MIKKNNSQKLPSISIIIPVFNEEKRLPDCLKSIKDQDYPLGKIEILVIDDDSTDKTVEIAKKFGAKIFRNGKRNIEWGKSIGLKNAANDYVFLIDADNRLPHPGWLSKLTRAMSMNPRAVGGEAIWFYYDKKHDLVDRYSELFGINDPMAFYLQRRDRLMAIEKSWTLPGKIVKETNDYYLIEFNEDNLLTVGSQGFLARKNLLLKTKWQPYLFHMDSNMDLIKLGFNQYVMLKDSVVHLHSQTISQFLQKLRRNFILFLNQENIRRYTWRTNPFKLIFVTLSMVVILRPLFDSINGFFKKPDRAWFLHPLFCFLIPLIYVFYTIKGLEFKKIIHLG